MHRTIVRAALICGATGIALGVWAAADDTAAQAAEQPPTVTVDLPTDLLDHATTRPNPLPAPAAKPVRQAIEEVKPALRQASRQVEATTTPLIVRADRLATPVDAEPTKATVVPRRPATRSATATPTEQLVATLTADRAQFTPAPVATSALRLLAVDPTSARSADPSTPADTPAADRHGRAAAALNQPQPSVDQQATPPGGPSAPALLLLDELLPRAGPPASRTTHLDPRPA